MKKQINTASEAEKIKKITLKDYYEALPKPVVTSEKQRFLDRIAERCKVSDTTVRNWCMYGFKPQRQEYIDVLVEETGIPASDLFAYTR